MKVLILNEEEIRRCVGITHEAMAAVSLGYTRLSEGRVSQPPVIRVDIPAHRGEVDIKTAYVEGLDRFAIKVASGFFDNPAAGLPYGSGMMLLMSSRTGLLEAVLLDNGYLTDLRTGIAGAIAAKYLAPRRVETAGVVGTGMQARFQMRALKLERDFRRILVHGRNASGVARYVAEMSADLGVEVEPVARIEELVTRSQVVVTTTPSREPWLRAEWLHPGLHITAVGADGEHKQELFAESFARADRIVCDSRAQCVRLGELHHAIEAGVLASGDVAVELGTLTGGTASGRQKDSEITICDLTGVGVQDTTIAVQTYDQAVRLGIGTSSKRERGGATPGAAGQSGDPMQIETFEMERTQCLYENAVELNLSESGVLPLTVNELLVTPEERERFLGQGLCYAESDGSQRLRENIAQFYPECTAANVTVTNGGSEANFVTFWTLLGKQGRLACMLPNYMQAWGLGGAYGAAVDPFQLVLRDTGTTRRWALDLESLERAVTPATTVVLVTNPNNPTGAVLNELEMDAVVAAARRVGAWLVVDEIYRGAEVEADTITPTFWGRYERVIVTSGLSKAFGLPGLRIGWIVAPKEFIANAWIRHDYMTLTPGLLNDRLAAIAMEPTRREEILARTRRIIRQNLPVVEDWLRGHREIFDYARPRAGAIAYFEYSFNVDSIDLIDRLRREHSVLVTPAGHFGARGGIRVGFGYDAKKTLAGLRRFDSILQTLAASTKSRSSIAAMDATGRCHRNT